MIRWLHFLTLIFALQVNAFAASLSAPIQDELEIQIKQQDLSIRRIKSNQNNSKDLIIWVAPGFGTHKRAMDVSIQLATLGIEIWHVDLAESLFLTKNTHTMRKLDGKYLLGLIEYAHKTTSKNITLLTRSYGAIPALRALREWQLNNKSTAAKDFYLKGAILFSPELYSKIPQLGLEPEFVNIINATNMPLMIFQGEKRSNRWQAKKVLNKLQAGGSSAYYKLVKGVNGVFYSKDNSKAALKQLDVMPKKIISTLKLLGKTSKPSQAAILKEKDLKKSQTLDIKLKPFKGNPIPHALDLVDAFGKRLHKDDYLGKITVVNFWATWCPPCVEEIPSLNNLRSLMKKEKFELISVNYGENKETVQNFMKKVNVDFPVLLDPSGAQSAKWNVLVFPSTFVIGPDGKIKYGVNAAIHWDNESVVQKLKDLLNKKAGRNK